MALSPEAALTEVQGMLNKPLRITLADGRIIVGQLHVSAWCALLLRCLVTMHFSHRHRLLFVQCLDNRGNIVLKDASKWDASKWVEPAVSAQESSEGAGKRPDAGNIVVVPKAAQVRVEAR